MKGQLVVRLIACVGTLVATSSLRLEAGEFSLQVRNLDGTLINAANSPGQNQVRLEVRRQGAPGQGAGEPIPIVNKKIKGAPPTPFLLTTDGQFNFEIPNFELRDFEDQSVVLIFSRTRRGTFGGGAPAEMVTAIVGEIHGASDATQALVATVRLPEQMPGYSAPDCEYTTECERGCRLRLFRRFR
jgi:hypothetical protein